MGLIGRAIAAVDRFQQRHQPFAFVFAVVKKYGDDNAGVLVTDFAYSAFVAVFPLLLLLVTVLGIVLRHDTSLANSIKNSTLADFPVIGKQLASNISALKKGSVLALVVAVVGLLWSSTGVAQAGLYAMAQVWDLPGPQRPNYLSRLVRSLAFLGVLALGVAVTTVVASFGTFSSQSWYLIVAAEVVAGLINVGQYFLAFRVLTPKVVRSRDLWPGAVLGGAAWTGLQAVGGYFLGHQLKNTSEVYGTFAAVLGLLAWVYLGAEVSIYAAEVNVVVARRLWPRALAGPPFTDADQRSLAAQVTEDQRRRDERIGVSFSGPPEGSPDDHGGTGGAAS
jgi:YihY family inner membrane protein